MKAIQISERSFFLHRRVSISNLIFHSTDIVLTKFSSELEVDYSFLNVFGCTRTHLGFIYTGDLLHSALIGSTQ